MTEKTTENKIDISTFLDERPMTRTQWAIFILSFVILMFDGFDTVVMGFLGPRLMDDWGIGKAALGPIFMSGLIGLAVGALTTGPLADRFGRKVIVIGSIFFFGVWSLVSAYSWSVPSLCVFRFLTGMGLGASMPNTVTILSEFAPKRYRSWMITTIYCGFSLGAASCGLITTWLVSLYSWRAVLVFGGVVPIVFALILIFILPESTRFLMLHLEKNRERLAKLVNQLIPGLADGQTVFYTSEKKINTNRSVQALLLPDYRLGTITLWVAMLSVLLANYLLSAWFPTVIESSGLTAADGAIVGTTFQVGGAIGNFMVGFVMDRFEHHKVIVAAVLSGAVFTLILALQHLTMLVTVPLVFLMGITISCVSTGLFALAAHTYPTEIRATGVSWSAGIGRFGSIAGAGAGGIILGTLGLAPNQVFMFATIPLIVSATAIIIKGRQNPSYSH